jgi:hypothetical protein
VKRGLLLARHRLVQIARGAVLDLLARQAGDDPAALGIDAADHGRRQQHPPAGQPGPGVDDEVADQRALVVEIDVAQRADLAVVGLNRKAPEVSEAAQHRLSPALCGPMANAAPAGWVPAEPVLVFS